jgi:peptidoglycan/LPS O-acetylase OafA/YrhL
MTENSTPELTTEYVSATDANNGEQSSSQHQEHASSLPNSSDTVTTKPPRLHQLDGFRFLVAFWLVFAHNFNAAYNEVGTLYERFCYRRYFGVQFFLVLSGFVSQYAYGQKNFSSTTVVFKFIVGRIGSVLACHYFTQTVSLILRYSAGHYRPVEDYWLGIPLSYLLLQTWIPKYAYFGNTPAWTLSTLAAHWVFYPWIQPRLNRLHDTTILWGLGLVPLLAMIPALVALWGFGSSSYDNQYAAGTTSYALTDPNIWYALYTNPLLRLPDFLFGCLLSERYVRRWRSGALEEASSTSRVADGAILLLILLTVAVPYTQRGSIYDTLMIEGPMVLFGVVIYYGSFPPITRSLTGYLMSLPTSRWLGDFAFQVYLFRYPIFALLSWYEHGTLQFGNMYLSWPYFIVGSILLYGISYLWFEYVDTPFRKFLTQKIVVSQQPSPTPPHPNQKNDKSSSSSALV